MAHSLPSTNAAKASNGFGKRAVRWRKLRPRTLGLVTLALSIFLVSSGYKLSSLRIEQDHAARVPMAKLWLETRGNRTLADFTRRVFAETPPNPSGLPIAKHRIFLEYLGAVEKELPRLPVPAPSVSLLPPRSPPLQSFCLA